jgi:hypothetical protein
MAHQNQNITAWKGNKIAIVVFIEDATNLVGFTAKWAMAVNPDSAPIITKTTPSGISINGLTVTITINGNETNQSSGIAPGDYYHELTLYDETSATFTALTGTLTLKDVLNKE